METVCNNTANFSHIRLASCSEVMPETKTNHGWNVFKRTL